MRSLFIFRRDLRLDDNNGLIAACGRGEVVPVFIFDPRQCDPHDYFSANAFQFLRESLDELAAAITSRGGRLFTFYGPAEELVADLLRKNAFDAVVMNKDYTPFSRHRDLEIKKVAEDLGVVFESYDDALLYPPDSVLKSDGTPYTVFTPFRNKALGVLPAIPQPFSGGAFFCEIPRSSFLHSPGAYVRNPLLALTPGRRAALDILSGMKRFKSYERDRNFPAVRATTGLSAHLKFGTVSAREVFHAVRRQFDRTHPLVSQLVWRDFFTHIAWHFPHVFGHPFYEDYEQIPWKNDQGAFKAWCLGLTGFPLVDAGMRELNATGFMHNRVRMVTASVLVKDLHIDWRWGERYFARQLVDYDPAVNNGNWQWAASTGCDHQPYFRVFNPELQQKRFDPALVYVKRWVPEYGTASYPRPIVDHAAAAIWIKDVFKAVR